MLEVVHLEVSSAGKFLGGETASPPSSAIHQHRLVTRNGIQGLLKGLLIPPVVCMCGALEVSFIPFFRRPDVQNHGVLEG